LEGGGGRGGGGEGRKRRKKKDEECPNDQIHQPVKYGEAGPMGIS